MQDRQEARVTVDPRVQQEQMDRQARCVVHLGLRDPRETQVLAVIKADLELRVRRGRKASTERMARSACKVVLVPRAPKVSRDRKDRPETTVPGALRETRVAQGRKAGKERSVTRGQTATRVTRVSWASKDLPDLPALKVIPALLALPAALGSRDRRVTLEILETWAVLAKRDQKEMLERRAHLATRVTTEEMAHLASVEEQVTVA